MLCFSETSVTLYHSTWCSTSKDLILYHNHCEDTKSHSLWLPVSKLYKVIITAVTVQVVTARRRQGHLCDYVAIILLLLGTDLLNSDCMTCHSASGCNDLQAFPARCCQSSRCY